jgi:hypothetical protein
VLDPGALPPGYLISRLQREAVPQFVAHLENFELRIANLECVWYALSPAEAGLFILRGLDSRGGALRAYPGLLYSTPSAS